MSQRSVLIIEDDATMSATISGLLADEGFVVLTAPTFERARDLLFGGADVGVVLLDLNLDDEEGESLLAELAQLKRSPPVVVLSALISRLLPAANTYGIPAIAKPFDLSMVVAAVEAAFENGLRPIPPATDRATTGARRRVKL